MLENNPIFDGLKKLMYEFRLTLRLMRDSRVPLWSKSIPVLAFAYVVMPFDFIPDFILIIGQIDDLAVLYGAFRLFRRFVPPEVIEEHMKAMQMGDVKSPEDVVEVKNYRIRQK
jgi:uncharacterized membrane protein YkvA (DUF1232 family)